jgi:hypothetical protein
MTRDDSGRFVKGQTGNPSGRPKRRTEEQYLDATIARVTIKDWREIVDKAVMQAKKGDSKARQWLSDYILGPPVQKTQVSGPDDGPIPVAVVNYRAGIAQAEE